MTPSADRPRYIEDWLTAPPKDLRPDSTDEEVRELARRIITAAEREKASLEGESPEILLLRMRADLAGDVWEHTYKCHTCGKYRGCRVSCRTLSADPRRLAPLQCLMGHTDEYGEDLAVWEYLGALQVSIEGDRP